MKTPAPDWKYPKREGIFDDAKIAEHTAYAEQIKSIGNFHSAADAARGSDRHQIAGYVPFDWATDQGIAAPALRTVRGYLTYGVTFAAGWFLSALYSLARLKGWL